MSQRTTTPRAELHTHLGAAVDPVIMWTIAHRQGIKLPVKDYWDFEEMITVTPEKKNLSLDQMDKNYYHWTELIQSSPEAIEEAVHAVIGGGYRKCNLVLQELRFSPMKRNRTGERDLDLIILAALWGMRRAIVEYPQVNAGLIISLDRSFTPAQNAITADKAIRYMSDGIVGIDIAGPDRKTFSMAAHAPLITRAKKAGLGITIHAGETGNMRELEYVVRVLKPDRIGHGLIAAQNKKLLKEIARQKIILEVCPTSNLCNSILKSVEELYATIRAFIDNGVRFTINTDGPEMYRTSVLKEEEFLLARGIMNEKELAQCMRWAFEGTFIRPRNNGSKQRVKSPKK
ncbi:MAG TPA: adenosine deaminase [Candidatus Taylorbacteria bacterium]|nr:MAG: Adenosine deaminase [Parcubacteria group bacterium GW2011_GWC2_48_17]HBV01323.1 adenosine deaminase [Candidatus Taylorbacteria bacterium]